MAKKKKGSDQTFSRVEIAHQFEQKTGKAYHKDTMKNKFYYMKKLWKDWKALQHGETGLGWDAATGKITADPEWWEKKIQENPDFKTFRYKIISQDVETMWDQLFGSIVATGHHCVAPSMDGYVPPEPRAAETDLPDDDNASEDDFDRLLNIDLDNPDAEILQDVLRKVSEPSGGGTSRGAKRSVPQKSQTEVKTRKRLSTGSVLFNQQMTRVGDTSEKILALYEQDVGSSAMAASSCKKSLSEAMAVIEAMIEEGLLVEGTTLWCFSVDELTNPDSRELFFAIPRKTVRKSWLEVLVGVVLPETTYMLNFSYNARNI